MIWPGIFRVKVAILLTASVFVFGASAKSEITSKPCPYDCKSLGLSKAECRDWRVGNTCYVDRGRRNRRPPSGSVICVAPDSGSVVVRPRCLTSQSETELDLSTLVGPRGAQGQQGEQGLQGEQGVQGPTGIQGVQGEDGQLRIYGDGSAGVRAFAANTAFNDSNPQYADFSIDVGVTLTVPSGTVIRCTGTFVNEGTISVLPGLRNGAKFAENGAAATTLGSVGGQSLGGVGGTALAGAVAKGLLRLGLLSAGAGFSNNTESDGVGGGNVTILCNGAVSNEGTIIADGDDSTTPYFGGGGGGYVVLASATAVSNSGSIVARGGDGGAFLADDGTYGYGPGGGGGGGVIHLIAPSIQSSGTTTVTGGAGGAAGGAGAITAIVYYGGGGGGGAGGNGGSGGAVNPGNIGNNSTAAGTNGASGTVLQTVANPAALY